jgi:hypothetical protein
MVVRRLQVLHNQMVYTFSTSPVSALRFTGNDRREQIATLAKLLNTEFTPIVAYRFRSNDLIRTTDLTRDIHA